LRFPFTVAMCTGQVIAWLWRFDEPLIDRFDEKRVCLRRNGQIPNPLSYLSAQLSNQRVLNIEQSNHCTRDVA
jgi:hypothetical protein